MEPTVSDPFDYKQPFLLDVGLSTGTVVLSERVKDTIPELSGVATSFLEAVGVIDAEKHSNNAANAEKHFQALHEFWMHKDFVPLLNELSDNGYPHLLDLANFFARNTSNSIKVSRFQFISKDPSLKDILNEIDPSVRLRGAISILIRYWCVDNKLDEYFLKNFGLCSLGFGFSFAAAAAQEAPLFSEGEKEKFFGLPEKRAAGPTALAPESKRSRPTTMSTLNEFSPIGQLVNVPSIQRLAQDVEKYPILVELAKQLLSSLEDAQNQDLPRFRRNKLILIHCDAVWDFWWNQDFCVLMREHLLKDPHLFVMEWRDVLNRRYSRDEAEIKNLLGKIGFDYTRLNVVLKNDGDGKLCMTCTI